MDRDRQGDVPGLGDQPVVEDESQIEAADAEASPEADTGSEHPRGERRDRRGRGGRRERGRRHERGEERRREDLPVERETAEPAAARSEDVTEIRVVEAEVMAPSPRQEPALAAAAEEPGPEDAEARKWRPPSATVTEAPVLPKAGWWRRKTS